jgi:hypothetical protein
MSIIGELSAEVAISLLFFISENHCMLGFPDHAAQAVKNHAERFPQADNRKRKAMRMAQFLNVGSHEFKLIARAVREQVVFDLVIET